jgi:HK97 family phage prohead protease
MMDAKWINVAVKAVDAETRTMEGMASTQSPDYGGDVVLASAWKASLRQWKKMKSRPKFLAYHKHSTMDGHSPVIGKILEMRITEDGLWFKAWFAETDLGEEHLYLYSKGAMDAFSVGFMPMEVEHDGEKIAKLLKKHGIEAAEGSVERVITQAHLLEVSCVVVGMNMEALVSASAEDEAVAKVLDRLERMAGLQVEDGVTINYLRASGTPNDLIPNVGTSTETPTEWIVNTDSFDFEDTEDIQELGPPEEEPEYDEDPLGEALKVKVELKPDATIIVLRELVDLFKTLNVRFDCLESDLKNLAKVIETKAPDQPGEVEPAPKDEVEGTNEAMKRVMGDLNSLRPELAKARRRAGLE